LTTRKMQKSQVFRQIELESRIISKSRGLKKKQSPKQYVSMPALFFVHSINASKDTQSLLDLPNLPQYSQENQNPSASYPSCLPPQSNLAMTLRNNNIPPVGID